jgi:hypothetical protein
MGGLSALAETRNACNKGGQAAHVTLPGNPAIQVVAPMAGNLNFRTAYTKRTSEPPQFARNRE